MEQCYKDSHSFLLDLHLALHIQSLLYIASATNTPFKIHAMSTTTTSTYPKRTGDSRTDFLALFPLIVDELVTYMKSEGMPEDAIKWYTEVSIRVLLVGALRCFAGVETGEHMADRISSSLFHLPPLPTSLAPRSSTIIPPVENSTEVSLSWIQSRSSGRGN